MAPGRAPRSVVRDCAVRESQLLASHRDVRPALADLLVERYAQARTVRRQRETVLVARSASAIAAIFFNSRIPPQCTTSGWM